jgi:virulence-associated protein VagC
MPIAEITKVNGVQSVKLPPEIQINADQVSVRREGTAVILEPVKAAAWPEGFFEAIHIDDPAFERPEQGSMPPAPRFD